MTDDSTAESGRVARLKAGLNLNIPLGAKPPIGFRPVLPPSAPKAELHVDTTISSSNSSGGHLEVAKKPPPPPVSPKPRAADRKDSAETKKAEVAASAKDADVPDGPPTGGFVSVSKLREKLHIPMPAFNPNAHHAADSVDSASRPDSIETDSSKVTHNGAFTRLDSADRDERPPIQIVASKPSPVHIMINPAALLPGAKRKTSDSTETTDEHRPLECLTKGRPKMARRRAPTSANPSGDATSNGNSEQIVEPDAATDTSKLSNNRANGKETESEVSVLSSRVKTIAVSDLSVDEDIQKGSELKLNVAKPSSPLYPAMDIDESGEKALQHQSEPAKHTDLQQSYTTPSNSSDATAVTTNVRDDSPSDEEGFEIECTEL